MTLYKTRNMGVNRFNPCQTLSMRLQVLLMFLSVGAFLPHTDAWWLWGKKGNNRNCPARSGANPYYFGTTNLSCMRRKKFGKRGAPWRGTHSFVHRFIYYKGKYFDFLGSYNKVAISNKRFEGHRCGGGREGSPAGYSSISLECLEGCARNYRCWHGSYRLLTNNCHHFANKMSALLCTRSSACPRWCQKTNCNGAFHSGQ